MAEAEATLWVSAQSNSEEGGPLSSCHVPGVGIPDGPQCFIDGSWKDTYVFSKVGWCYFPHTDAGLMLDARNIRRSISPLHVELEALIWVMHCLTLHQKTKVTDCSELIKMMASPHEWPAFGTHPEDFERSKTAFTCNAKADNLV